MIFPRLLIIASSIRNAIGSLAGDIGKYADEYWNSVVLSLRGNVPAQDFKNETVLNMHMDGADPDWGSVVLGMHMGGGEVDPYWSNVSLLMLMNGTNASTAIGDVTGKTVTVNGNAAISTTQSKFGGSSCYFDGAGDYLTVPNSSDFTLGTGDFTLEAWVNVSGTGFRVVFGSRIGTFTGNEYLIYVNDTGVASFYGYNAFIVTGTTNLTGLGWAHIAVTRSSSVTRLFVNGKQEGAAANDTLSYIATQPVVGANVTASQYFQGYIDNLRITKGVARYTDSFTPPNREFPAGATTLYDVKGHPVTVAGNTAIVATQSRFGGYSCYFDGSGDYLKLPMAADFNMGTGDFTIEFWYYPVSAVASDRIMQTRDGDVATGLYISHVTATSIQFYFSSTGAAFVGSGITIPITQNKWQHIAIVNSTASAKAYVDGAQAGSTYALSGSMYYSSSDYMVIGGQTSGRSINGYIDDLRITKGVAKYTAAFTPPSRAFPHDVAFVDEKGLVPVVSGTPTISTTTLKYGYGSASLNGTTDYLTFNSRSDFGFGTGDFTLEAWINTNAIGTLLDFRNYISDYGHFYIATGGYLAFDHTYGAIIGTTTVTDNNWHHIAFVRYNSILTMYVDGVNSGTGIANANIGSSRQARIGAKVDGTNFFAGNIDQLRLTKAARYVGEFTPQRYQFEDVNNNQIWRDETGTKTIMAYGNAKVSTSTFKYGNGSMYFDGNGDYVQSTFEALGTGDLTIEFWCNLISVGDWGRIIATSSYLVSGGIDIIKEATTNKLYFQITDTTTRPFVTSNSAITDSIWHHCACQRRSNTLEIFIDGVKQTATATDTPHDLTSTSLKIGTGFNEDANGSLTTMNGYLDDLRITKGIARYMSNFTPPVRQNANYGLPAIYDPYWDAVVLGMHMDGTNGGVSFTDVKGKTVTVTGNTNTVTAIKKFGTASAYFDGTGDSLSLASSSLFDLNDMDFTIEFWMYPTSIAAIQVIYLRRDSATAQGIAIELETDGKIWAYIGDTNTSSWNMNISTSVLTLNTWSHIALVRNSSTFTIYLNGVAGGSYTGAFTVAGSTTSLIIGASDNGTSYSFYGYLDDLRVTKGVARYTSNFQPAQYAFPETRTPVKTLLDPYYDNVVLNMHMNGPSGSTAFVDEMGNTVTAFGNVALSTTQSKFGGVSTYFDGTGDYLTIANSPNFNLGTSDFTIELWSRFDAISGTNQALLCRQDAVGTNMALQIRSSTTNKIECVVRANGSGTAYTFTGTTTLISGVFYNIVLTRYGGIFKLWLNGIEEATLTQSVALDGSSVLYLGRLYDGSAQFAGYIDDFRITKGTARYITNFTLPALPNPDFKTVPAATDPYWKNVVLHMPMNGADGGTTFTESTGKTVTVNGNTSTQVEQYRFGGSSAYFDGTGDYLTVPSSSSFALGSDDFTIEAWVYVPSLAANTYGIVGKQRGAAAYGEYALSLNSTNKLVFGATTGGEGTSWTLTSLTGATAVPLNSWCHVAVTRSGTLFTLWQNGVDVATSTASGAITSGTASLSIGSNKDDGSFSLLGYIDDLRITKGVARYTSAFTPLSLPNPTGYDPYAPNVILHLPMNTDFTDGTGKTVTVSGNTAISTTTKKFGAGSGYFDGAGDYLSLAASTEWNLGTGAFTLECWVYPTVSAYGTLIGTRNDATSINPILYLWNTGVAVWYFDGTARITGTKVITGGWHHVAVCRSAGVTKLYVDGIQDGSSYTDTNNYSSSGLFIGANVFSSQYLTGYIDDLRITKGVARYTTDFTPPREPFSLT